MANLTPEQQKILDAALDSNIELIKANSVAGSGKTTVLTVISKEISPKNGLYLAYNKAIATEASRKFSKGTSCMTTHSLAYQNTVSLYKLRVGFFNYKNIKERISYEEKVLIIDTLNSFSLSKFHKFDDFVDHKNQEPHNISDRVFDLTKKYFAKMMKGEIDITHAGYLKFYHMLLANGKIQHKEFDLIMLDEAGDLNAVTLEVFKLLPSKKKIMVGDENQNIYTFNDEMRDVGLQLNMTQSFRCSEDIAEQIEGFCRYHIDRKMSFKGVSPENMNIKSIAFISRNNSTLVGKMIELNTKNVKYNLTRPAKSIFELVLIVLSLKPGGQVFSKEWKFLQEDADEWERDYFLKTEFSSIRKYIAHKYGGDPAISSALNILAKFEPGEICAAYENAKAHEKESGHDYTLCTAHSSKGLEFDRVVIAEDMNTGLTKIVDEFKPNEYEPNHIEAMRLYYVACSRALKQLDNAIHLELNDYLMINYRS